MAALARKVAAASAVLLALAGTASGEELDALSASRDAPVFEVAYGPRAQLSIGGVVPLVRGPRLELSLSALAAIENARSEEPIPDELGRLAFELRASWRLDAAARRWFGAGGGLAVGVTLGSEGARLLGGVEAELLLPAPQPGDIPFGGGGDWTGFFVAGRVRLGRGVDLLFRGRERVFWNGWPLLFGRRDWSDVVADVLREGLAHAPALEATVVWQATPCVRPLAGIFAEGLFPHDRSADGSGFFRLLAGVGLPLAGREAIPFVSLDAGAGKGLLVNRHEVRLSLGVRLGL